VHGAVQADKSLDTPSCSHSVFAPILAAASAMSGVSSERRNTSTMSTGRSISASDAYAVRPSTSVSRGLTGITS